MSEPTAAEPLPTSLRLAYDPRRFWRHVLIFPAMGLVMALVMAVGIFCIIASWQGDPWGAGAWVGTFFGLVFTVLGGATTFTAAEVTIPIVRMRRPRAVLTVDERGIAGIGPSAFWWNHAKPPEREGWLTSWADMAAVAFESSQPMPARRGRAAFVGAALDRGVGQGFRVKDGTRTVIVTRLDGSQVRHIVSLPIGEDEFTAAGIVTSSIAAADGVECYLDLDRAPLEFWQGSNHAYWGPVRPAPEPVEHDGTLD